MILFDLLQYSPVFFYSFLVILGLTVGSFLNVVIHRLPVMLEREWQQESDQFLHPEKKQEPQPPYNLAIPGSHCPHCQHRIKPWENIPVLSYILLKGQCSSCQVRISIRYPTIELASALITAAIGWHFGVSINTLAYCLFAWCLLALSMIDFDTKLLPDHLTLPLLWAGLLFNSVYSPVSLFDAVWGAAAGYLSLWLVYQGFKLLTGKEGMGFGDFKLLAALGAWLGWSMLPMVILLSSLTGTVVALTLIVFKLHNRSHPIPFGPYLSAAGFIALLWGDSLLQTYIKIMGL